MKKIVVIAVSLLALVTSAFGQIGNPTSDLVYTPLTPCRIVDTRKAGGTIPAGTARGFKAWGSSFAAQGGDATDCGIPQNTNVAALALNMVVVGPGADGWIAAYPFGGTLPNSSTLNYLAGAVLANGATVKVSQTSLAFDWNLHTTSTTHFVADVLGFYSRPVATSFECESPFTSVSVPANGTALLSKACTAGFTLTGGGCDHPTSDTALLIAKSAPLNDNSGWFCRWQNTTAVIATAYTHTRCCRIAGR
jgi:hypothetical protein